MEKGTAGFGLIEKDTVFFDILNEQELKKRKKTQWIGKNIVFLQQVDSTNTRAGQLAKEGAENGTYVIAEMQTAGRGRRGRTFDAQMGQGIFMTLIVKPCILTERASMLTLVAALAVSQAITKITGENAAIKWPNDIIMHGKKVCGILTEMTLQSQKIDNITIGIGINVHNEKFPNDICHVATSLFLETGIHFQRAELVECVWEMFEYYYEIFLRTEDFSQLAEEYNARLVNLNREVCVLDPGCSFCGKALGITEKGELIVEKENEKIIVSAGEVSVRGVYGYV